MKDWRRTWLGRIGVAALVATAATASAGTASADDDASWRARYEAARQRLVNADYRGAEVEMLELAQSAPGEAERKLASEMAELAAAWAERAESASPRSPPAPPEPAAATSRRTGDELTLLYTHAFLYGLGTSTWFLLQVKPDSGAAAILPFVGFTAGTIGAVGLVDGYAPFRRGLPHAIAAGVYLGFGQGVWIVGAQHARVSGLADAGRPAPERWRAETVSTVLWTTTTLGGIAGGALGAIDGTTPGRVSFVASSAIWSGLFVGAVAAAALPEGPYRYQGAFIAGGAAYNVGLVGGVVAASSVSMSVARARFLDLGGVAGGVAALGLYSLAAGSDTSVRGALATTAAGALVGLASAWVLTSHMPGEQAASARTQEARATPVLTPVAGGAVVGAGGSF
jgi:hypothetical protein